VEPRLTAKLTKDQLSDLQQVLKGIVDAAETYLQWLPYKSNVLTHTQDTSTRWGTMRQVKFIDQLKKKIRRYGVYYADQGYWVDLAQSPMSDPAGRFYPIPLTDLP